MNWTNCMGSWRGCWTTPFVVQIIVQLPSNRCYEAITLFAAKDRSLSPDRTGRHGSRAYPPEAITSSRSRSRIDDRLTRVDDRSTRMDERVSRIEDRPSRPPISSVVASAPSASGGRQTIDVDTSVRDHDDAQHHLQHQHSHHHHHHSLSRYRKKVKIFDSMVLFEAVKS